MAFEKILILESSWAENEEDYIGDYRSSARIYLSLESLLSLHETPVFAIQKPLLTSRYLSDIEQFTSLPANELGPNLIIICAHGSYSRVSRRGRLINRRRLHAIDGTIKLSKDIHDISDRLSRTIFVLDACDVGTRVSAFRNASGALGVIGFSETVDWVDSTTFILAMLLRFQTEGVFQMDRASPDKPKSIIQSMRRGAYHSLMKELGVTASFRTRKLKA